MPDRSQGTPVVLMSGGSRGIGLAIAERLAAGGAKVAFIAKTDAPDPRLPGTVHSAADAIRAAGGEALPFVGDIRDRATIEAAVAACVDRFGGIDVVINNASAIDLRGWGALEAKRFDLMLDVNVRGTFGLVTAALPHLLASERARVLTLSPPINLDPRWVSEHAPYTVGKYAMTLLTLGVAEQYRGTIAANCLWPETLIATAAVRNVVGGDEGMKRARRPEIMADAAACILGPTMGQRSGECLIDSDVLRAAGWDDLSAYDADPSRGDISLQQDLFV